MEYHDLYFHRTIVLITPRRMKWAERVAVIRKKKNAHKVLVEIPEGENQWGNLGMDGTITLTFILKK